VLLAVAPFGLITGVAMVASGIAPWMAMLMSVTVFAGASMIASAQLLASGTPLAMVLLATAFINLRFMMYSATLRPHFAHAPLRWRLLVGYLVADNVVGLSAGRFADHPDDPAKLEFFLGVGAVIWVVWQLGVAAGAGIGEVQTMLAQFVMQGFARNPERFGETAHGTVRARQFGGNQTLLEVLHLLAKAAADDFNRAADAAIRRTVVQRQFQTQGKAFGGVLQFTYIAWPGVAQ